MARSLVLLSPKHFSLPQLSLRLPRRREALPEKAEAARRMAFTFATVALAVRLLQCNNRLTREAFLTFREVFPLEDAESALIRKLFMLAWRDGADAVYYARQVAVLYSGDEPALKQLLQRLCAIAVSDGPAGPAKLKLLTAVAAELGYTRATLSRLMAEALEHRPADPFRLLGVPRRARASEIKQAYRNLMRRYHPDHAASSLCVPEAVAVAERRAAMLTEAYGRIMRRKKIG